MFTFMLIMKTEANTLSNTFKHAEYAASLHNNGYPPGSSSKAKAIIIIINIFFFSPYGNFFYALSKCSSTNQFLSPLF